MTGFTMNLKEFKLNDVLQFLVQLRKTGILHINGEVKGEIYLKDGIVIHTTDGTEKGLEALLNLSFAELEEAIFEPNIKAPEETITEEFGRLFETIEKRRIEFEGIKDKLPPRDTVLAKSTKELDSEVSLRRTDWQILALIDGKRTLNEVIIQSRLGGYEAIKIIVWLKEKGLIYDPKETERIMSVIIRYLQSLFRIFGKHTLNWLKRWAELSPDNQYLFGVIEINEESTEIGYKAGLTREQIDQFMKNFEQFIIQEGPQLYGRLLFKKKMDELKNEMEKLTGVKDGGTG